MRRNFIDARQAGRAFLKIYSRPWRQLRFIPPEPPDFPEFAADSGVRRRGKINAPTFTLADGCPQNTFHAYL
jgi:hypothetical protein